ncbi:GntR family transcriptional regulator [Alteromonas sediminis]|nr:GntR family transcriptional regulator [Alteromonas sediminis]
MKVKKAKNAMNIEIDVESDTPIFTQLVDQIKQSVASKSLKPGMPLPSIRQLANQLGINPNTVSKAYKLLERDSVIIGKGYRGTFIHDQALEHCETDLNATALTVIAASITQLRELGLTDSEIRNAFTTAMK